MKQSIQKIKETEEQYLNFNKDLNPPI